MGARQTKFVENESRGNDASPSVSTPPVYLNNLGSEADPRSPHSERTPICLPSYHFERNERKEPNAEKPLDIIKRKLINGFGYNCDPRSPGATINRTPVVFEDSRERTFNLDDTFADLFVNPSNECAVQKDEIMHSELSDCKRFPIENNTEEQTQKNVDPRSPSIGVDRTPIVFVDEDNDTPEDDLLENVLAILTLNLDDSAKRSLYSVKSSDDRFLTSKETMLGCSSKPLGNAERKTDAKLPLRKPRRIIRKQIYEDRENFRDLKMRSKVMSVESSAGNRTPLSCLKNRAYLRSRSVETSPRLLKAEMPLKSFDDTLNNIAGLNNDSRA